MLDKTNTKPAGDKAMNTENLLYIAENINDPDAVSYGDLESAACDIIDKMLEIVQADINMVKARQPTTLIGSKEAIKNLREQENYVTWHKYLEQVKEDLIASVR